MALCIVELYEGLHI